MHNQVDHWCIPTVCPYTIKTNTWVRIQLAPPDEGLHLTELTPHFATAGDGSGGRKVLTVDATSW